MSNKLLGSPSLYLSSNFFTSFSTRQQWDGGGGGGGEVVAKVENIKNK